MEKVRVCLIGCGRAGMIHARAYNSQVMGAELIGLCDPFEESLNNAQKELNVKYTYTDYKDVMANPEIDAVVVVTPTKLHKEIVVAAANAHKNVFCEKPMADSKQECEEMIEACKKNNVKLQIGFMRRFDKSFRRAKEMLDSGAIGKVTMVKSNTYGPSQPQEWMYDVRKSYGPLGEVNSHDFDTLRWYAGSEVKAVYSIGHNFRSPEKASEYPEWYDTCSTTLEFENGIIGIITGAQYVKYGYDSRAEILGTDGIIKTGSQDTNTAEMVTSNREIHKDSMDSWRTLFKDAYAAEDQAFVNCILNDTEPEVTGHDGMMALMLVNESLRSLLEHKRIEL